MLYSVNSPYYRQFLSSTVNKYSSFYLENIKRVSKSKVETYQLEERADPMSIQEVLVYDRFVNLYHLFSISTTLFNINQLKQVSLSILCNVLVFFSLFWLEYYLEGCLVKPNLSLINNFLHLTRNLLIEALHTSQRILHVNHLSLIFSIIKSFILAKLNLVNKLFQKKNIKIPNAVDVKHLRRNLDSINSTIVCWSSYTKTKWSLLLFVIFS